MQQACREDDRYGYVTNRMYAMGAVISELDKESGGEHIEVLRGELSARKSAIRSYYVYFKRHILHGDELDLLGGSVDVEFTQSCPYSSENSWWRFHICSAEFWVPRTSLGVSTAGYWYIYSANPISLAMIME